MPTNRKRRKKRKSKQKRKQIQVIVVDFDRSYDDLVSRCNCPSVDACKWSGLPWYGVRQFECRVIEPSKIKAYFKAGWWFAGVKQLLVYGATSPEAQCDGPIIEVAEEVVGENWTPALVCLSERFAQRSMNIVPVQSGMPEGARLLVVRFTKADRTKKS